MSQSFASIADIPICALCGGSVRATSVLIQPSHRCARAVCSKGVDIMCNDCRGEFANVCVPKPGIVADRSRTCACLIQCTEGSSTGTVRRSISQADLPGGAHQSFLQNGVELHNDERCYSCGAALEVATLELTNGHEGTVVDTDACCNALCGIHWPQDQGIDRVAWIVEWTVADLLFPQREGASSSVAAQVFQHARDSLEDKPTAVIASDRGSGTSNFLLNVVPLGSVEFERVPCRDTELDHEASISGQRGAVASNLAPSDVRPQSDQDARCTGHIWWQKGTNMLVGCWHVFESMLASIQTADTEPRSSTLRMRLPEGCGQSSLSLTVFKVVRQLDVVVFQCSNLDSQHLLHALAACNGSTQEQPPLDGSISSAPLVAWFDTAEHPEMEDLEPGSSGGVQQLVLDHYMVFGRLQKDGKTFVYCLNVAKVLAFAASVPDQVQWAQQSRAFSSLRPGKRIRSANLADLRAAVGSLLQELDHLALRGCVAFEALELLGGDKKLKTAEWCADPFLESIYDWASTCAWPRTTVSDQEKPTCPGLTEYWQAEWLIGQCVTALGSRETPKSELPDRPVAEYLNIALGQLTNEDGSFCAHPDFPTSSRWHVLAELDRDPEHAVLDPAKLEIDDLDNGSNMDLNAKLAAQRLLAGELPQLFEAEDSHIDIDHVFITFSLRVLFHFMTSQPIRANLHSRAHQYLYPLMRGVICAIWAESNGGRTAVGQGGKSAILPGCWDCRVPQSTTPRKVYKAVGHLSHLLGLNRPTIEGGREVHFRHSGMPFQVLQQAGVPIDWTKGDPLHFSTVCHHPLLCESSFGKRAYAQKPFDGEKGCSHCCARPSHLMKHTDWTNRLHEAIQNEWQAKPTFDARTRTALQKYTASDSKAYAATVLKAALRESPKHRKGRLGAFLRSSALCFE